jgi:galactokinase
MYLCVRFQLKMTKLEVASLSATSERYIGTEGGGMDQAIAFLGTEGLYSFFHCIIVQCPVEEGKQKRL